jgi:hypothetical protein
MIAEVLLQGITIFFVPGRGKGTPTSVWTSNFTKYVKWAETYSNPLFRKGVRSAQTYLSSRL